MERLNLTGDGSDGKSTAFGETMINVNDLVFSSVHFWSTCKQLKWVGIMLIYST